MDENMTENMEKVEGEVVNEENQNWFQKSKKWCKDHKSELLILLPVVIPSVIDMAKIATRSNNLKEEKHLKENCIYDRSLGHYYETKRKVKSSEWLQIDHRRQEGELIGDILKDMKLLK